MISLALEVAEMSKKALSIGPPSICINTKDNRVTIYIPSSTKTVNIFSLRFHLTISISSSGSLKLYKHSTSSTNITQHTDEIIETLEFASDGLTRRLVLDVLATI